MEGHLKFSDRRDNRYFLYCPGSTEEWQALDSVYSPPDEVAFPNLSSFLRGKLKCKSILIEEGYICADFRDEFSTLYSKTFRHYDSYCTRLHFFSKELRSIDQIREVNNEDYLGFSIIRPIEVQRVGRTIVVSWRDEAIHNIYYPLCRTDFKSHIMGREFKIQGMPYTQQDSMVMVCAHSAIWMASRYMSQISQAPHILPSEINFYASQVATFSARSLPSESLYDTQMIFALQKMGYSPFYFLKQGNDEDLLSISYPYLESKIPVILGVPGHVVTAVGHTFDPQPEIVEYLVDWSAKEGTPIILRSEYWVSGLIIHDDSQGPYRLLPINRDYRETFSKPTSPFCDLLCLPKRIDENGEETGYETFDDDVDSILIPVPNSIFLLERYVKRVILSLFLTETINYIATIPTSNSEILECFNPKRKNPLVLRTYSVLSSDYKMSLRQQLGWDNNLSKRLVDAYEGLSMPQYVWICEITTKEHLSQQREDDRRILGEILVDAKAHKSFPFSFLAIHLPGVLLIHDQQERDFKTIRISDDNPYRHHTRR